MKKICITQSNKKFNKNIQYYTDIAEVYEINTKAYSIYKIYYSVNSGIDIFIINLSCITKEVASFINDFKNHKIFIIYIDGTTNIDLLNIIDPDKQLKYIVDNNIEFDGIKLPKYIINDKLYRDIHEKTKTDDIVYFLDNVDQLNDNINNILYPNTKLKIKMFNNSNISHPQNLGLINETEKKDILLNSGSMIYTDESYVCEAIICGCSVIDGNQNIHLDSKHSEQVPNHETYSEFLRKNIL